MQRGKTEFDVALDTVEQRACVCLIQFVLFQFVLGQHVQHTGGAAGAHLRRNVFPIRANPNSVLPRNHSAAQRCGQPKCRNQSKRNGQ